MQAAQDGEVDLIQDRPYEPIQIWSEGTETTFEMWYRKAIPTHHEGSSSGADDVLTGDPPAPFDDESLEQPSDDEVPAHFSGGSDEELSELLNIRPREHKRFAVVDSDEEDWFDEKIAE